MSTSYPILTSRVQTGSVDVSVTSAYGASGQLVSYSGVTDSVRIWNQDTNYKIEYKIDSADWLPLGPNKQVSVDLDLSVSAIRLRLAEFVPSGRPAQIEYTPKASGVFIPDAEGRPVAFDGISGGSTAIAFSAAVPFNAGNSVMPRTAVTGALAFTVNSTGAADGNAAQVELISDGTNVPSFTGMSEWGTSFGYDNSQAGLRNLIQFFRSGGLYYYSISQPSVNTPIDLVAPTAGVASVADATPTVINLVIGEAADTSAAPSAASFTVSAGHTVSSVAWGTSTRLDITVTPAFVNGEAARTLAYTPGTNPIKDVAGNLMAAFSGKAITNNVGASAGTLFTLSPLTKLTNASDVYTADGSGVTSFGAYGRAGALTLAGDGWVSVDWPSASNGAVVVGFDKTNTVDWSALGDDASTPDYYFQLNTSSGNLFRGANNQTNTLVGAALAPGAAVRYRLKRTGTTITIEESGDSGGSWAVKYTFGTASTGTLYVFIATIQSNAFYRPRHVGLA